MAPAQKGFGDQGQELRAREALCEFLGSLGVPPLNVVCSRKGGRKVPYLYIFDNE